MIIKLKQDLHSLKLMNGTKAEREKKRHKRVSGYHSFTSERPKQQFQMDLIMLPKIWRNNKKMYALVCIELAPSDVAQICALLSKRGRKCVDT
jgi:hypothetical protein